MHLSCTKLTNKLQLVQILYSELHCIVLATMQAAICNNCEQCNNNKH